MHNNNEPSSDCIALPSTQDAATGTRCCSSTTCGRACIVTCKASAPELIGRVCAWQGSVDHTLAACTKVLHPSCFNAKYEGCCSAACYEARTAVRREADLQVKLAQMHREYEARVQHEHQRLRDEQQVRDAAAQGAGASQQEGEEGDAEAETAAVREEARRRLETEEAERRTAAARQRELAEEARAARVQLGLPEQNDTSSTPLTLQEIRNAFQQRLAEVEDDDARKERRLELGVHVDALLREEPGLLQEDGGAGASDDRATGADALATARDASRRAATAQQKATAAVQQLALHRRGGTLAALAAEELDAFAFVAEGASEQLDNARAEAASAEADAENAVDDLVARALGLDEVHIPHAVPRQLADNRATAHQQLRSAQGAVRAIDRERDAVAGTLAEIREQRDGPTAEERALILTALNTHFKDSEPTLELVLPYASTDAARQAACRVAVRAAVNQWRGAAADGERTPAQRRWRQHAGWANERSLDEGADKAVAGLVDNADANELFAPGARPRLARPAWARPRDAALEGAVLQEARALGASWDTDTYRSDVAVISVKEAFIEAYFAPLTDSALPEGVKTADAIAHLEDESCYGRRARAGPTEVCGLCKRHSTFCSRLEQLADAGAAATSPPAPPGYHFFRLEVAKPALFCWCEPPRSPACPTRSRPRLAGRSRKPTPIFLLFLPQRRARARAAQGGRDRVRAERPHRAQERARQAQPRAAALVLRCAHQDQAPPREGPHTVPDVLVDAAGRGAAGLFRDRRAAGEAAAHRLNYQGERDLRRSACRQCK